MKILAIVLSLPLLTSCGEEGNSIGAPAIKPPVDNNMPAGFKAAALALASGGLTTVDAATEVKNYFYPTNDFVGPLERLGLLDDRMSELNRRAEDSARKCVDEAPREYDIGGMLPGDVAFVQKYNCQESQGSVPQQGIKSQTLAFGMADNLLYLNEHRYDDDGSAIVVLVQAAADGKKTEVWDVRWNASKQQADVLHILGDDTDGIVEVTSSGMDETGSSGALACGIHARASGDLLYFVGRVAVPDGCRDEETLCYNAATLAAVATSECEAAGLNSFSLSSLNPAAITAGLAGIKAIAAQEIAGYMDFNTDRN